MKEAQIHTAEKNAPFPNCLMDFSCVTVSVQAYVWTCYTC